MSNPFKPNDKVLTKHKGGEVEATVRLVWKEEVQVRLLGGMLVWRTVRTVRVIPTTVPMEDSAGEEAGGTPPIAPNEESTEPVPATKAFSTEGGPEGTANVDPVAEQTASEPPDHTELESPKAEIVSCGLPEEVADRKRNHKGRRRR